MGLSDGASSKADSYVEGTVSHWSDCMSSSAPLPDLFPVSQASSHDSGMPSVLVIRAVAESVWLLPPLLPPVGITGGGKTLPSLLPPLFLYMFITALSMVGRVVSYTPVLPLVPKVDALDMRPFTSSSPTT